MQPADIVMINQLLALYGHIVDAAQWSWFDELFLPDAELDYTQAGADTVYRGIAEIQDFFRGDYLDIVEDTPAGWRFRSRICVARWQFTSGAQPEDMRRRTW